MLAWAWHPTRAEAVAWISGRPDVLVGVGLLLCVSASRFGSAAGARSASRWRPRGSAALTSKESGVVAPALIAMEAWSGLGRPTLE